MGPIEKLSYGLPLSADFASAIETLVTAISLIKQSKIAGDDRCKILISSLQDTLHGIEEKSYGSKYVCIIWFCNYFKTNPDSKYLYIIMCFNY